MDISGAETESSTEERYNLQGSTASSGLTIPTMLTLLRVAAVPVLVGIFFMEAAWVPGVCAGIFLAAAITDWLDGYLARKMNSTSAFGAFLDPVADKLIVSKKYCGSQMQFKFTEIAEEFEQRCPYILPIAGRRVTCHVNTYMLRLQSPMDLCCPLFLSAHVL